MQTKKIVKILVSIILPVIVILAGLNLYFWYHYANKNNLLEKYIVDNSKEIYILGTIGKKHFNRINNYSMEDLISAIDNINPDIVLLTARDDHKKNYNIVDGDIDTCVAYSYCLEKGIPMQMVDWWFVDNIYPVSTTTNLRDDNIFIKVSRTIGDMKADQKIMLIVDSHNFYEQVARFKVAGFKQQELDKNIIKSYFVSNMEEFKFPSLASKTWKDRSYFYAYVFPRALKENKELFDSVKEKYLEADHEKFYRQEIKYCMYLNNNLLYK